MAAPRGGRSVHRRSDATATGRTAPDTVPGDPEQPLGDPEAVARAICLRLLDHRARSRAELATALERKGVPADAAGRVLDRFAEVGLIDDAALAEAMATSAHRERGLARRAVALKLRQRGLSGDDIDAALTTIDGDSERARAVELVRRRQPAVAGLPPDVASRRLVGLLGRKGYPPGLAYDVVRSALAGAVADSDGHDDGPDDAPVDGWAG